MEDLTIFLCTIFVFCMCFYLLTAYIKPYRHMKELRTARRVLFVTAHPDDEVMFFGPTILGLLATAAEVFLLCLSPGDHYGLGKVRKTELYKSCSVLGVKEQNIVLVRHTKLKDDPGVRWREELVSDIVMRHVTAHAVDTVVTFDRYGVSGHKNHISLYYALACLAMESKVGVFCLSTVNLLRKYSSVVDVPMSFLLCTKVYVASVNDWLVLLSAMSCHESQYTWFRRLYMIFSRYTLINTLEPLTVPQLNEKKES